MRKMDQTIVRDQAVFVGIDVSKKSYAVAVRSGGVLVYRTTVPARYGHLRALWARLPGCRIQAVYEAGFSGFGLYDALVGDGVVACVTPPSKVARTGDRVKTDRRDARTLAHQLESGMLRACRVPTPEVRVARDWSRYLNQLIGQQTRLKAQIKSRLDWHGIAPALDEQRRWSRAYRAQVQGLVTGCGPLQVIVEDMLVRLTAVEQRVTAIKLQLRALTQRAPYRGPVTLLASAPGVGWLTAIRLVLEWQDPRDFPNGAAFASYLGLTPSEYSSGDQVRRGAITRQGNGRVRAWLIEAAWRAITQDPALGARFRRLAPGRAKGMRKRAIVAVARTLALRLRACWMSGQPYVTGVVR